MAPKNVILAALAALILPVVCLQAQTRSLIYNATNGEVIANTGTNVLTFTNNGIGFKSVTVSEASFTTNGVYSVGISTYQGGERYFRLTVDNQQPVHFRTNETLFQKPINFNSTNGAAETTRANIGFSTNLNNLWTATNASNAMRALAGSTNTNQPFSGLISFQDFADDTHTITVSNGIIVDYSGP